jgi:hypothetical protein
MNRLPYEEAVTRRPHGACYCNHDDRECYRRGHWNAMPDTRETYLGDAVYASFDGWQIKLRTGDGNNQVIYLEPGVMQSLIEYTKRIEADMKMQSERHAP